VQLAARLCAAADAGEVLVSVAVRELCIGKLLTFEENPRIELKGLSEPVASYKVAWH
jgi:class 3 adenylate cyclase